MQTRPILRFRAGMPGSNLRPVTRRLAHLAIIGDTLAIRWEDDRETFLTLETLRRACPCAGCGGEPDVLGRIERPGVSYGDSSFQVRGYQLVGGYGWQPTWEDGHNTGIYSFSYLERLEHMPAPSGKS